MGRLYNKLLAVFLLLIAHWGFAQQKTAQQKYVEVKASTVADAATELSRVFNLPLVISNQALGQIKTPQIRGEYTFLQATQELFGGLPIDVEVDVNGFILTLNRTNSNFQAGADQIEEVYVVAKHIQQREVRELKQQTAIVEGVILNVGVDGHQQTLADSLSEIPGAALLREGGEGRQVSLRAMAADFTQVTLDGMPLLINNNSPMDSREQKQWDRAFDYNVLAPSTFQRALVYKSYSAQQTPGGIAGTIELVSPSAFSRDFDYLSLDVELGLNTEAHRPSNKLSIVGTKTWGNWGTAFTFNVAQRMLQEQGVNTFRWRQIAVEESALSGIDTELQNQLSSGDVYMPRGNRYSLWKTAQTRANGHLSLEYQNPEFNARLNFLAGQLQQQRQEFHLYPRGESSTPILANITKITDAEVIENQLLYARYDDAIIATESREHQAENRFWQSVVNMFWQVHPNFSLASTLGHAQSQFFLPQDIKVYTQGFSDLSVDYRSGPSAPVSYRQDVSSVDSWRLSEMDFGWRDDESRSSYFDLEWHLALSSSWQVYGGVELQSQTNFYSETNVQDVLKSEWSADIATSSQTAWPIFDGSIFDEPAVTSLVPQQFSFIQSKHNELSWLALKANKVWQFYCGGGPSNGIAEALCRDQFADKQTEQSRVNEAFHTAYIGADYILFAYNLDIGLAWRTIHRTVTSSSINLFDDAEGVYRLPSLYLHWQPSEFHQSKLSLSKNISFPFLSDLASAIDIDQETNTLRLANPSLSPYLSKNIDFTHDYFFDENGFFSVSIYYKEIEDYVIDGEFEFGDISSRAQQHLSQQVLSAELGLAEEYRLLSKVNAENATIKGIELNLAMTLAEFPKRGAKIRTGLQAAFNDSALTYYHQESIEPLFTKRLPFTSKEVLNLSLNYLTESFNTKLTANYRSDYIFNVNNLADQDESGFLATTYWDASFSYLLSGRAELGLFANNITGQKERQYSDSTRRLYNVTESGRHIAVKFSYIW